MLQPWWPESRNELSGKPGAVHTFFGYPKGLWRGLRTTNSLENLNREFTRRTKTQGSFSAEEAALTLLFGLVAFRQIELRKICGYKHVAALMSKHEEAAA